MAKRMIFTLLVMNSVGHNFDGGCRYPRARNRDFKTFDLWPDLARKAEAAKIDEFFFTDTLGVQGECNGSAEYRPGTLREKIFGADDPHISRRHPAFGYRGMFS
ncbi:hypothetical protein AU197_04720 [Mycobacterium sp. IS-1590]|uniref:hypothetical protein n=1 Tax=Mycobacterium sp. IS-1590 TaxID=1772286 RepID=UPI00074A96BE|nr:hypothetical protein [Mycobacterium sp. IS-1590]KUI43368.1 hypothetical protein AU197_04720 [Mycobacterium sp. IS-1590]